MNCNSKRTIIAIRKSKCSVRMFTAEGMKCDIYRFETSLNQDGIHCRNRNHAVQKYTMVCGAWGGGGHLRETDEKMWIMCWILVISRTMSSVITTKFQHVKHLIQFYTFLLLLQANLSKFPLIWVYVRLTLFCSTEAIYFYSKHTWIYIPQQYLRHRHNTQCKTIRKYLQVWRTSWFGDSQSFHMFTGPLLQIKAHFLSFILLCGFQSYPEVLKSIE